MLTDPVEDRGKSKFVPLHRTNGFYIEVEGLDAGLLLSGFLGVIGAKMGFKLFVALQLEVAHHFVERSTDGHTRSLESPPTF
ncbi:MAG: hypothetical protein WCF61_19015 [Terriglobales bacterium]